MTSATVRRRGALLLAAALALSVAGAATAAPGYYRWTDDNGKVQFTQQPPEGRAYQFIRTSTGTAEHAPAAPGETPPAASQPDPEAPAALQGLPAKDPEQCEQARNNLAVLNGSARIRARDDKGEYRFLETAEIDEQKTRAQEAIDVYCD